MFLKVLVYYYFVSICAVAGGEYEKYYGNSIFQLFNTSWGPKEEPFPLSLLFQAVEIENVTGSQCVTDLKQFHESLRNYEPWSVQMADSSGGLLPGALSGNLINLGGYDECISVNDLGHPAKYCWLKITINGSVHQDISFVPHNVPIIQALCVPNSCKAPHLQQLISAGTNLATGISITTSCQDRPQTWGPWEICGTVLFSLLIMSSILSTVYDKVWATDHEGLNQLWCSFSLTRNLKSLSSTHPNKFSNIEGLRVLSQFVVIIYHIFRDDLKNDVPVFNKFSLNKIVRSWEGIAIVCGTYSVDTFTVVGGFLVMYSIMRKQGRKIDMTQHIVNRFFRIYPAYAICLVFMLTLAGKICDGPLCESIVYSRQDMCKEVWWTNALCVHNIYPGLTKSCMSHTWYVAVDWQLYVLLSPLLIIGVRESKAITIWAIVGTAIASVLTVFFITVFYDLKTDTLAYDRASEAKNFYDALYTEPYTRLGPWCVGLLFGMFMHNEKKNKFTLTKAQLYFMWGVSGLILVSAIVLDLPFQKEGRRYSNIESGLFNALSHVLWAAAICWIIFACSSGYGGPVNAILSASTLQLLGKLSFSTYLVHKLVVNLYFSNLRGPIFISSLQQGTLMMGLIALSFMASIFLHLLAEAPSVHIGKFLVQEVYLWKREDLKTDQESSQAGITVSGFDALELGQHRSNSQRE